MGTDGGNNNVQESTPEERLEWLRFAVKEGDDDLKAGLADWMQEVETQVANLRKRLNELPQHFETRTPRW